MVSVHASEEAAIRARGAAVVDGLIVPPPGERGCPFKSRGLCLLHDTPAKPFGCIASPFTLNANDTLIVRNRYKLLPCYKGPGQKQPAYRAYYSSLVLLFGEREAGRIAAHFDKGGGDFTAVMPLRSYKILRDNDAAKRAAKEAA